MLLTLTLMMLGGHHGHHSHSSAGLAAAQAAWLLDDDGHPWVPVETMTRESIMREDERLHADWPSVGKPVGLLVVSVVLVLVGVGFTIGGAVDTAVSMAFSWALGVGLGSIGLGLVLLVTSVVLVVGALEHRRRYDYRLEQLERRLETLDAVSERTPASRPVLTLATF